jgi:hypothetical protein
MRLATISGACRRCDAPDRLSCGVRCPSPRPMAPFWPKPAHRSRRLDEVRGQKRLDVLLDTAFDAGSS